MTSEQLKTYMCFNHSLCSLTDADSAHASHVIGPAVNQENDQGHDQGLVIYLHSVAHTLFAPGHTNTFVFPQGFSPY